MRLRRRAGQSTLEYLVIVAVIIAIVVAVATGVFKDSIQSIFERAGKRPNTIISNDILPN